MQDEPFADYGLNNLYFGKDSISDGSTYQYFYHDTINTTDLDPPPVAQIIDYYGLTWSLRYAKKKTDLIIGGAFNKYDNAKHFGEMIWAEYASQSSERL